MHILEKALGFGGQLNLNSNPDLGTLSYNCLFSCNAVIMA